MRKLLIYYSFIIVSLMVAVGFISASSIPQLISAVLFFPLFIYFAIRVLPNKAKAAHLPVEPTVVLQPARKGKKNEDGVVNLKKLGVDVDRRMFLKAIASAGLSVFLFAIFTKKAEAAFFGSVPGPGVVALKDTAGNKIDPSEKQPTDGYNITELDDAGTPAFYGFVNKSGAWYIMKEDSGATPYYSYTKGSSDFTNATTGWPNRTNLSYDYFSNVFT